jgi:hypothetical protein
MLPLEQSPDVMRLMLAALRRGLDPRRVVAGRWDRLPENARTLVTQDLAWQASAEGATLLHFNPQVNVGAGDLERVMRDAVDFGADVLIIDHLHALDPGTTYSGFRRLCVVLNELPKAARIPVLTTAQMHRGEGDPLAAHRAPRATGIQMGDVVRQFAHIVLGAWRPLSREPSKAEQVRIRTRQIEVREFLEPNCIELAVLKQRVDGDQAGQRVRLRYEHGEIVDPTWEQVHRWSREAQGQTQLHVEDR